MRRVAPAAWRQGRRGLFRGFLRGEGSMSYALTVSALVPLAMTACAVVGLRYLTRNRPPIRNPVFARVRTTLWRRGPADTAA